MKKVLLITVVCLLAIISLQLTVLADMGAPEIEPYKASVSNVNGANYYNGEEVVGKLEYGTVIDVAYEYMEGEENELKASFASVENEFQYYTINVSDIIVLEEETGKIEYDKESKISMIIIAEDGVEISKGPAYAYEKTGVTIPKGTEITGYRTTNMGGASPWLYVTYEGTSGWVCELNGAIGYKTSEYETVKLLTPRKTSIYKDTSYKTVVEVIPANTILTDFLYLDDWSQAFYVTYEGVSGYLSNGNCAVNYPWLENDSKTFTYELNYPAKLYKEGNAASEVLIENIPEGTELEYAFGEDIRFAGWIYTTYNNISGWVYYLEDGTDYENYLQDAVYPENTDVPVVDNEKETSKDTNDENVTENEVVENGNIVKNEAVEENEPPTTSFSGTQIVILCIMFAIIIAVTSFVTIALVNRKKK